MPLNGKNKYPMKKLILILAFLMPMVAFAQEEDTRPKVGLVLAGGGAKAAAHIGALKEIEKAGIKVDYITGASFGAVVGALYAAGYSAAELEEFFLSQEWLLLFAWEEIDVGESWKDVAKSVFSLLNGQSDKNDAEPFGLLKAEQVEDLIGQMLSARGVRLMQDFKIPFRCVATELNTLEEIDIRYGAAKRAIRASMSYPGLFKPIKTSTGKTLVDGGMLNNLPVDLCVDMGADVIIAVDLQQGEDNAYDFFIGRSGLLKWSKTRPDIMTHRKNVKRADVYINPNLAEYNVTSFTHDACSKMLREGENEARKFQKQLQQIGQDKK